MKARHWTFIFFAAILAFSAASWGRVVEWWNDMSPAWKAGVCTFVWGILILIGVQQGKQYALAAVIIGPVFMCIVFFRPIFKALNQ